MKVLATAKDVGGANAIAPVLKRLLLQRHEVRAVAYGHCGEIFQREGVPARPAEVYGEIEHSELGLRKLAGRIFSQERPDIVLVGTSWGISLDKELVMEGIRRDVPTVAVLDMWSYYRERFSHLDDGELCYLPSRIAVMDELAYADALTAGIPGDRMTVTGQPYFDSLMDRITAEDTQRQGAQLRSEWGRKPILVFASELISRDFPPNSPRYLGYTEQDALAGVLAVLSEMKEAMSLVIKLHPQERADAHRHSLHGTGTPIVAPDVPALACIVAADVVVGMTSMFLLEAAFAKKPTISFQPHLAGLDGFIGNRLGLTRSVYDASGLRAAIQKALQTDRSEAPPGINKWFDGQAAARVERVLFEEVRKTADMVGRLGR